ncbi:helix-turn-helix domain-containing protein [Pseudomonas eucalypticola]|uniref:Helix-turn-helix transcriptional regulator n=1 Tax=Pseudomonas eucalypticola TaxID=2599595 RepID=A0A7D5HFP3_9PSED|nr:AraC family transcriptional regulator [Pseudomonas eucalypticola]QKZ04166.1 helix-turn-helix transcriptional regulator [Pseudomonas eucalypticola]
MTETTSAPSTPVEGETSLGILNQAYQSSVKTPFELAQQTGAVSHIVTDRNHRLLAAQWRLQDSVLAYRDIPESTLTFHISGSTRVAKFIDGRCIAQGARVNSVSLTTPGSSEWELQGQMEIMHLYLPEHTLRSFVDSHAPTGQNLELRAFFAAVDPWLTGFFTMLGVDIAKGGAGFSDSLLLDSLWALLLSHLFDNYMGDRAPARSTKISTRQIGGHALRMLQDYLADHLAEDVSLRDLAALVNLSEGHLLRVFRSGTGLTPYQYLISIRIDEVKRLLRHSDLTAKTIARMTGFASPAHMGDCFRRRVGITPGDFRQKLK